jgi:hypothetical protein
MNLLQISRKFNTPDKCYKYLEKLRWGKKPVCPYCGSDRTVTLNSEFHRFHCYDCHKSFSVTVGTIFEDSRMPLPEWFYIVALMTNAKMGINTKKHGRIGVYSILYQEGVDSLIICFNKVSKYKNKDGAYQII